MSYLLVGAVGIAIIIDMAIRSGWRRKCMVLGHTPVVHQGYVKCLRCKQNLRKLPKPIERARHRLF